MRRGCGRRAPGVPSAAAGYTVQRGAYAFLEPGDCCGDGMSCFGNNPGGSYGYSLVPPAPGQTSADSGYDVGGARKMFHLGADEVVVTVGLTPPPAAYFGFRTHVMWHDVAGELDFVLATNGDDLSSWVVQQRRGDDDVSLEPLAVVTSADATVEADVHALLEAAGFAPTEIEDDRIGADVTTLGLGDLDDQLSIIHRAAVFDDPVAEAAYRADPGLVVLRLTPTAPLASPEPHVYPGRSRPLSGVDESAWAQAVDDLEAAIVASAPGYSSRKISFSFPGADPLDCLADGLVCGDLSSRLWVKSGNFGLPLDGSFAVAFGVNHERSGKVVYSSVSAQAVTHNVGLESIDSRHMVGSAAPLLPGDPLADDLFAIYLARDCLAFPDKLCIEIPTGCPGVEPADLLYGASRLYVERATGMAPNAAELVGDQLLVFNPGP